MPISGFRLCCNCSILSMSFSRDSSINLSSFLLIKDKFILFQENILLILSFFKVISDLIIDLVKINTMALVLIFES